MHRLTLLSALLLLMAIGGCAGSAGNYDRAGPWTNQHNPAPTAGW